MAKQYPTKYKQITIYTGVGGFANTDSRNKILLKFKDSYRNEIDDLVNNLKPIEVTFKHTQCLKESLNEQAYFILRTELNKINENVSGGVGDGDRDFQKLDINDSKDDSIRKSVYKVENDHLLSKQSSR